MPFLSCFVLNCYSMEVIDELATRAIDAMDVPFYIVDVQNFNVVLANTAAQALGVRSLVEPVACYALVHRRHSPCEGTEHPCPLMEVRSGKESVVVEHLHLGESGEISQVEVHAVPIFNGDGEVVYVAEYLLDYGRTAQLDESLLQTNRTLTALNQRKTQLLAGLSHDIRTPLASVLGFTEMLQGGVYGALTPEQQGALQNISRNAEQLLNFVNNMLGQAQLESGELVVHTKPVLPAVLLSSVEGLVSSAADLKGLSFSALLDPRLPGMLLGDPFWLRQILLNLLMNAVKFTKQGQVSARLSLVDAAYWQIEVSDTGPGIPREKQSLIFEPFRQANGSQRETAVPRGSGLGLAIVKEVTERMNGRVTVSSSPGSGSTFVVTLPLLIPQKETDIKLSA